MQRIEKDWYSLMNVITSGSAESCARKQLREELLAIAPVFGQKFFLSDEFSLVDCYLAPLLWRLPAWA
jgi:RNA polymerase-associated protein